MSTPRPPSHSPTPPVSGATPELPSLRWIDAATNRPLSGTTEAAAIEALRVGTHDGSTTAAEYMGQVAARLFEARGIRITTSSAPHFVRDLVLAGELSAAWDTGARLELIPNTEYVTARVMALGYDHHRETLTKRATEGRTGP